MRFWVERARAAAIGTTAVTFIAAAAGVLPAPGGAELCPNAASRSGPSASLPDCRVYEMVSPVENEDGDVYVPDPGTGPEGDAISTQRPFRAAADGNAVAYVGDPSAEGNGAIGISTGNSYLATREPAGGWKRARHPARRVSTRSPTRPSRATCRWGSSRLAKKSCPKRRRPKNFQTMSLYSRINSDGAYQSAASPPSRRIAAARSNGSVGPVRVLD